MRATELSAGSLPFVTRSGIAPSSTKKLMNRLSTRASVVPYLCRIRKATFSYQTSSRQRFGSGWQLHLLRNVVSQFAHLLSVLKLSRCFRKSDVGSSLSLFSRIPAVALRYRQEKTGISVQCSVAE